MIGSIKHLVRQWETQRPDVDLTAFTIAASLMQIANHLESAFRDLCRDRFGLGVGDMRILFALRRNGQDNPQRPTDLFQTLLITSGAVTKQVDRLVRKKLVTRMPDPEYQRGSLIRLTDKGVAIADAAIEAICNRETKIGDAILNLSRDDRSAGLGFLQVLLAEFDAVTDAAVRTGTKRATRAA